MESNLQNNKYYKQRDGSLYMKHSKEEIKYMSYEEQINILLDMNYPYIEDMFKKSKNIGQYIAQMQLLAFKDFTATDTAFLNSYSQ